MMCTGGLQCVARLFPFQSCESALIYELAYRSEKHVGAEFFSEQHSRRSQLEAEIETNEKRQRKLLDIAMETDAKVVAIEIKRLQVHIDALQRELEALSPFPLSDREMHENAALFGAYTELGDEKVKFRRKLKTILGRVIKKIEFFNGKKGWAPHLLITYVSDVRSVADVTRWLPQRTLVRVKNGYFARGDLRKRKPR